VDLHRDDDPNVLKSLYVREIVDTEPGVVNARAGLDEVLTHVVEGNHTELFVVNEAGELLGAIHFNELRRIILEQDELRSLVVAGDLLATNRASLIEDDDLDLAMQVFSREDVEEIAVVDRENARRLVGSIHKRDVLNTYSQEVMRRDLAGGVSSAVAMVDRVHQVDLGGGFVVQEMPAPRNCVGHTLADLGLRARFGVQVLLIRRPGTDGQRNVIRVPGPADEIAPGERLVVAGPKAAVDEMAER